MGRTKRRRRGVRRILRATLRGLLAVGILSAVLAAVAAVGGGNPLWALLALPLGMLALLVIVPILLFVLIVVALSLALPVATLAAVFGGPAYLVYRLSGRGGRRAREDGEDEGPLLAEDAILRRRYVAGQLTYDEFQTGMVAFLRDRFARGELRVAEYEAELEKLLAPARHMDVKRDPTVAAAPAAANVP